MLATRAFRSGGHFEESYCGEEVHRTGDAVKLDLAGSRTHAMAAFDETVEDLSYFGWKDFFHDATVEGPLAAGIHHLAKGAIGEHDAAFSIECGDSIGDGFEHCFKFATTRFEGCVGCTQLHGGVFDGATAVFKVGCHVIEAADQFA